MRRSESETRSDSRLIVAVVLVSLALRTAWVLIVTPRAGLFDDAGYYDYFARSLAAGHGYRMPWGTPTAFWPVGYPAVLGAFYFVFGSVTAVATSLNCLLGAATAGSVFLLGRRWFLPQQAFAGALVFAAMPGAIGFASLTLSETLFTFLFVCAVLLVALAPTARRPLLLAIALGAVVAAATHVRGQALLLPAIAFPWLASQRWQAHRALGFSGLALGVAVLLCLPWSLRNTLVFHTPVALSTNAGVNLWAGHHESANGGLQFDQQIEFASRFSGLPDIEQEPAESREGLKAAASFAVRHPLEEARLTVKKVGRLYRDDSDAVRWNEHNGDAPIFGDQARSRLGTLFDGYFYVCGLLGLIALGAGLIARKPWSVLLALIVLYWTLVHVVFFAEPRFHAPLLPLIALLAGAVLVAAAGAAGFSNRRVAAKADAKM